MINTFLLLALLLGQYVAPAGFNKGAGGGGGTGTITFVTAGAAAGPGISPTGQTTGDLLIVTESMNSISPTPTLSATSGCSASGSIAGATVNSGGTAAQNIGFWCIASSATPVIGGTNCSPSCRATYYAFRSTNGWNTSSIIHGTSAAVADANPVVGVSISVPGAAYLVFGELAQQVTNETLSASGSWTLGNQSAGTQVSAEVYQMNVGAATYNPSVGRNTAAGTQWVSLSLAMSTN